MQRVNVTVTVTLHVLSNSHTHTSPRQQTGLKYIDSTTTNSARFGSLLYRAGGRVGPTTDPAAKWGALQSAPINPPIIARECRNFTAPCPKFAPLFLIK